MKFILLAALAALLITCAPSQHDETHYGVITVAFGLSHSDGLPWRQDQYNELTAELAALNALGPTFVVGAEGTSTVVVRPFDSGPNCANGAARWTSGLYEIEIDPVCTPGYTALRAALGHEIGHALGMQHICTRDGEAPFCSPVGYGYAMMNPSLSYGDVFNSDGPNDIASDTPTDLDLAELRRVRP